MSQGMAIELGHRELLSMGIGSQGCYGSPMPVPVYPYQDCPLGFVSFTAKKPWSCQQSHSSSVAALLHPRATGSWLGRLAAAKLYADF